ncbi:MAG: ATP-dependent DNA helicase RecG [Alphaproteobacteria bacterium]
MRPEILFPLFAPATSLSGVGPRIGRLIEDLAGPHVVDLLWHLPTGLIDRRFAPKVAQAPAGRIATLTLHIEGHLPAHGSRRPYKVHGSDETGSIYLVFFHAREDYLRRVLPIGETRVVSGRVEHYGNEIQMTHPDHIAPLEEIDALPSVEPVYPLTAGLTLKPLARAIRGALERAPELPEWLDPEFRRRKAWPAWRAAVVTVHGPQGEAELEPTAPARERLAYDELLANQLALALTRAHQRHRPGRSIAGDGRLRGKVLEHLPFRLTGTQEKAIAEIEANMGTATRMVRLLQGDVGSGKTVVALVATLIAVEAGGQAALMAPTEILARQHMATIEPIARQGGLDIALLTGRDKGKAREEVLGRLARGELDLIIGTHALFQQDVDFKDLALAIIDEQHRFGVHQRMSLLAKGRGVDVLVMTATPIPRTLLMTVYGDMDVSRLTKKPPGRQPVDTRLIALERMVDVTAALKRAIADGARVYWVCPLVEESEALDLAAATERHAGLRPDFGDRVGLIHGRMTGSEKDRTMASFTAGEIDILVATTVIEVGVDVPEATVMVIEHAERFGLAQLHQLRGRVGRGERGGTCLLLYASPLSETAKKRLRIMRRTNNGFRIAEEDLRLRGAGELLGTRQSGMASFRLADLAAHDALLGAARDDTRLVMERDQALETARGEALRVLLYLFERNSAVKLLRSG